MRKSLCTLALAALAASAQAITANWTNSGNIASATVQVLPSKYWAGSVFAVTASFTASALPNNLTLLKVGRSGAGYEGNNYAGLRVTESDGSKVLTVFGKGGSGTEGTVASSFAVEANQRVTVSLLVDRTSPNIVSLFVNGKDLGVALQLPAVMNTPTDTLWGYGSETVVFDYLSVYGMSDDETLEVFTQTVQKASLLPEPTALALLALGVAGLALRRKAA